MVLGLGAWVKTRVVEVVVVVVVTELNYFEVGQSCLSLVIVYVVGFDDYFQLVCVLNCLLMCVVADGVVRLHVVELILVRVAMFAVSICWYFDAGD